MWKQQWKALASNRTLLISVIVLLFIPIMYAGTFLGSIWDPYGKTEQFKVAVINQDQAVEMEGTQLNVGEQLVDNLKENDTFDWQFVQNETKANEQLKTGDYYMVITIPKDFSKNAATILDEKPQKMQLNYATNPGKIMTGDLIATQGATTINQTISQTVTEQYSQALFSQITKMGKGFGEAADATSKLTKGTNTVKTGNETIAENLKKMSDSTLTFQAGSEQLVVGVATLQTGVNQLNSGASALTTGVTTYTNGVGQLAAGTTQLLSGANQLTSNSDKLTTGVTSLASGLGQLQSGSSALKTGVNAVADGNQQLSDGLNELATKAPALTDGIDQLVAGQTSLTEGLKTMDEKGADLVTGVKQLQAGISQLSAGLNDELPTIDTAAIEAQLTAVGSSLQTIAGTIQAPAESAEVKAVQKTAAFQALTPTQQTELMTALQGAVGSKAQQQGVALASAKESLTNVASALSAISDAGLTEKIAALKTGVAQLQTGVDQLAPGSEQLIAGIDKSATGSDALLTGAKKLQASAPTLTTAINTAATASTQLAEGAAQANDGVAQLASGINSASSGSQTLNQGLEIYTNGVATLDEGVTSLNSGAGQLAANSAQLQSGAAQLAEGTQQLATKTPALASGVEQLNAGAGQLHEGSSQLADGSNKLTSGLTQIANGTVKLGDTLGDASTKVADTNLKTANAKMVAQPTDLNKTEVSNVPNYGHGLAPYVMALALFVGSLTFNVIFPIEVPVAYPKSALSWWFSKFSVMVAHAIVQALLLDIIMVLGLGLEVEHMGQFVLVSLFTSLAYMSVVSFLAITFGNPGRFMAMILLVLQLGASAGTFPLELTNGFFQALHKALPMTYAVNGYRQALTNGLSNGVVGETLVVMTLFIIIFNAILIGVLHLKRTKHYRLEGTIED